MIALFEALGWAVIHALWQGSFVGLVWWLAANRTRASDDRYVAAAAVLVALAALFTSTVAFFFVLPPPPALQAGLEQVLGPYVTASSAESIVFSGTMAGVVVAVGAMWAVGAATLALRHMGGWRVARSIYMRRTVAARAEWSTCAEDVAVALGVKTPRVVESADIDSPAVFGVLRPVIVLPVDGLEPLSPAQLRGIIAHELAHVARRDGAFNLLQCAIEVLLFFHPVAHVVSRHVRREREMICDRRAVALCGDARTYVAGLLALERARFGCGRFALAARTGSLLDRARHLISATAHPSKRWRTGALAIASALVVALAVAAWPSTMRAGGLRRLPAELTITASDPAGPFTLTMRRGVAVRMSMDGVALPSEQIRQERDSVFVLRDDGSRALSLRLRARGGITWTARPPAD